MQNSFYIEWRQNELVLYHEPTAYNLLRFHMHVYETRPYINMHKIWRWDTHCYSVTLRNRGA